MDGITATIEMNTHPSEHIVSAQARSALAVAARAPLSDAEKWMANTAIQLNTKPFTEYRPLNVNFK